MITTEVERIDNSADLSILHAAVDSGVKYYRTNWFKYPDGISMAAALERYQKPIEELGAFNKKLGLIGCYQNHSTTMESSMIRHTFFLSLLLLLSACKENKQLTGIIVKNEQELQKAIANARPGDKIVMANGIWKDIQIRFTAHGKENHPIFLWAETPGKVFIEGRSDLKLGGDYLEVHDLYFRNGQTPSEAVIEFRIDENQLANHCIVTNCVIEDYNQLQRDRADLWVEFWGRHNRLEYCYLAGKSNQGPTVRVDISGNESIRNHHQIIHNHFGPRPRKGGPKAETIQIGDSYTSMSPGNVMVANNLFDKCNGEVEVISSKTNFNEFRHNVFYQCEGSLVTRHGNYCIIDGNYFIGDGQSEQIGGIRIINTGHWVTNNYFYNLKGQNFKSPLAVMNGIPKSPLNRYNQVTDLVVAYNSWINCRAPWQFGVGNNMSQKTVLPVSEIRSARPIRTLVANNLIYNEEGDSSPIIAHDRLDGVTFKNNVINNQGVTFEQREGLAAAPIIEMMRINDFLLVPKEDQPEPELYAGFEFETIKEDLLGNLRSIHKGVGAISHYNAIDPAILAPGKYGPSWFSNKKTKVASRTHSVTPETEDLGARIAEAGDGDILALAAGTYQVSQSLVINKKIRIQPQNEGDTVQIVYSGPGKTPCFAMHPKGDLQLNGIRLSGHKVQYAFATLRKNMSSLYNLQVSDCEISNFHYILRAYKQSFANEISFSSTVLKNCQNGIELSEETNDKGDYNVAYLRFDNCWFDSIQSNVIDYYRGGYDESTIGGNLSVVNCTFIHCGAAEENKILLNTRGIVNVDISKNTFKDNPVELVARLWGAKNNTHSENLLINSGELVVEEDLELKLVY